MKAKGKLLLNVGVCVSYGTAVSAHLAQAVPAAPMQAKTVNEIGIVEGRVAQYYWLAIQSIVPETFCFPSRIVKSHQCNASDPFSLCLNYAYGVIEGYVRKMVNNIGLEPSVGSLHEFTGSQTKESLVYDLQEPFRWLGDITTIEAFESGTLDLKDFYFTGDDYSYKIEIEAKRRYLPLRKERFNSGMEYKGKTWNWDTVIQLKTQELAGCLLGEAKEVDFIEPDPESNAGIPIELREKILTITVSEAHKIGISKGTLWHLQKMAALSDCLKIHTKTWKRLFSRIQL